MINSILVALLVVNSFIFILFLFFIIALSDSIEDIVKQLKRLNRNYRKNNKI